MSLFKRPTYWRSFVIMGFPAIRPSLTSFSVSLFFLSLPSRRTNMPPGLIKNNLFSLFSSRPGRPPKRGVPFPPMSPQDAMLHLKQSMQHNGAATAAAAAAASANAAVAAAAADPFKAHDGPFPKGKRTC